MTAWLLSIVGVVFLGVMVDIISPSGKTGGFIKSMFAIFLVYVVITPIVKLAKNGEFKIDEDYNFKIIETDLSVKERECCYKNMVLGDASSVNVSKDEHCK